MCVQNFDDSRGPAIRITYRISPRSSSLWDPRHPLLKVVMNFTTALRHPKPYPEGQAEGSIMQQFWFSYHSVSCWAAPSNDRRQPGPAVVCHSTCLFLFIMLGLATRSCRGGGAGAEVGGCTEHRCVDVQTEMQRCKVHRHSGEEVQRWCNKVVKMFSGAD